uniref:Uncharacterized protein n=1 Tax=Dunaliella tertiolecta TaxID=3047 RepID=A0A7S3QRT4_DUNTE
MQPSNGPPTEHDPQLAGREPSSHSVRSRHSHAAANAAAPSAGLAGQHEEAAAMSPQEHDQQMPAENPAPSGALPPTTAGSATRAQARVAPVPLGEGPGDGGAGLLGSQEGTAAVRRASGGQELGASPSRHSNKSRASSIPRSPSHSDPVPRALSPSKLPPAPPHSSPFQSSSAQASDPGGPSKHSAGMRTRIRPRPMIVPPAGAHGHVKVTSPTREERLQRKMWAEVAQRRKAEVAMRLQADEAQMQKERMERMEARRAAVRARIEGEKLAQKAMAEERAAKLAGLEPAPPPIRGKRNPSPRPLYLRLQDDYEARKAAEEEETRKKLEQMAQMKRVRVASLVSGEVTIKPLPGDIKPKESNSPPRWHPSFKPIISPRSTSPGNSPGMHSARSSSIFKVGGR